MSHVMRTRLCSLGKLGSLLDDIGEIARNIVAATAFDDVFVWTTSGADIHYAHLAVAPDVPAECVLGTYRMGVAATDIEGDLRALREARVCGAMLFQESARY